MADTANYQGPGVYEHYKGGLYIVFGLVRLEWNERTGVAYMTLDPAHREEQFYRGMVGTVRPLNPEDCTGDSKDPWNSYVNVEGRKMVPRFKKVM